MSQPATPPSVPEQEEGPRPGEARLGPGGVARPLPLDPHGEAGQRGHAEAAGDLEVEGQVDHDRLR